MGYIVVDHQFQHPYGGVAHGRGCSWIAGLGEETFLLGLLGNHLTKCRLLWNYVDKSEIVDAKQIESFGEMTRFFLFETCGLSFASSSSLRPHVLCVLEYFKLFNIVNSFTFFRSFKSSTVG
ncbi:hypothetical protein BDA99DRAFT_537102 [Phascolomyces articulosus]|uniref:Uncharacterized protein n=1 Tax=Phascolomyces articulosus TaxID=60185 RepID=A0AAD5KB67_9FUNG|nr:hypothetical protein BDA99DRAFT_537102 [Phascolomyces articulosus]